jgi:cell division septation protein DedD
VAPLEEEKKYGLLVGAFPDSGSAEEMLDKVREQGGQGFIRTTPGKKNGSQVIAGPFSSRREAYVAAISLKNKLDLETTIIPVSK